ncbi:cation:proton antiporter [Streptomyces sp. NBC_00249]|uniref:cation:proton antiporter n=1 Tax=Streptomyces sp. NBC_00249 TaxID=2975690 RepID=UPI002256505B|nr:cation:proton antiporter [Streptomyces sp. NBC_00249]MCX5199499.1 cation:proton antiporter [Streptomyces sp. NBC_00249]
MTVFMSAAAVAPLSSHAVLLFLLQAGALLALASALGTLAVRWRMPALVGELTAGVLLGPSVLGSLAPALSDRLFPRDADQLHLLDAVGLLGVLFLVALAGTQVDLGLVRRQSGTALRVSLGGLVVPLAGGVGLGLLLPAGLAGPGTDPVVFALFMGVAMCVSAIPVIAKTLTDMNLMHRRVGQLTMASAVFDDICGWVMLSLLSAMAASGLHTGDVVRSVLSLVAAGTAAVWVVRPVARRVLRRARGSGAVLTSLVVLILFSAAGSQALGLEAIVGAFACGLAIRSVASEGGQGLSALDPLRRMLTGVLAPLFFATAGLRIDLTALADARLAPLALLVLAVAVLGKFAGAFLGAVASRMTRWEGLALGAALNARGVIEVVIATAGLRMGVLTSASYTMVVLVAVVTSLMAPPLLRWTMARVETTAEDEHRLAVDRGIWAPARAVEK